MIYLKGMGDNMSDVTREIKELYSDYLNEKLDLIFNGVDGRVVPLSTRLAII